MVERCLYGLQAVKQNSLGFFTLSHFSSKFERWNEDDIIDKIFELSQNCV